MIHHQIWDIWEDAIFRQTNIWGQDVYSNHMGHWSHWTYLDMTLLASWRSSTFSSQAFLHLRSQVV